MRPAVLYVLVAAALLVATVILRGQAIANCDYSNPDEASLMAWARAALASPIPFSTWATGTTGPYWTFFLAGLGALGAPLTLAFAHLLSAILLAFTASALFVAASRAIGRGPALVATVMWWFPIATPFLVGGPGDFSALSTEYLPMLLVVASALVPREQLATRPWLFAVLGLLTGVAVGAKYQLAPLGVAFAVAQLIVLHPNAARVVVSLLWWFAGAALPAVVIVLVMVASPATNWTLVDQTLTFLASYGDGRSLLLRFEATFHTLIRPRSYLLVGILGLIWLGWHSERRSNLARVVLAVAGVMCMLIGGMGFPHYLIVLFGAGGLAATMPIKPGTRLRPMRLSPSVIGGVLAMAAILVLLFGYASALWRPLSPQAAVAAFSHDSVNRIPTFSRLCPPGSPALVWGWAAELLIAQDWQNTLPYVSVNEVGTNAANRAAGEPMVRAGIERAKCIVDATLMERPECPGKRPDGGPLSFCLPARMTLFRFYPRLAVLIQRQFHAVPIVGGCKGCTLYARNRS